MFVLRVELKVKPEFVEAFRAVTIENAQHSVQEAGIARFDVLQQSDDPTRFVLLEAYRSPEAQAAHRATAHYAAWREAAEPMLAEPRTRATYAVVFPSAEGR